MIEKVDLSIYISTRYETYRSYLHIIFLVFFTLSGGVFVKEVVSSVIFRMCKIMV